MPGMLDRILWNHTPFAFLFLFVFCVVADVLAMWLLKFKPDDAFLTAIALFLLLTSLYCYRLARLTKKYRRR
ncbi:hypothetical protein [Pseudocitrobacter cyperus]|uniref:Uncharacterized protein n=1 Tax=Pseudocitrobacter cyperus TaxID=3112843 RepID=A0ABV0HFY8_9ENTR